MSTTIVGSDGKQRCRWCDAAPEFPNYHDTEWGFPVSDDRRLFEKLSLESFQSGLRWRTILVKRQIFAQHSMILISTGSRNSPKVMWNVCLKTTVSSGIGARSRLSSTTPGGFRN